MAKIKRLQPTEKIMRVLIMTLRRERAETIVDFKKTCSAIWEDLADDQSYASSVTIGTFSPPKYTRSFICTIEVPIEKEPDLVEDIYKKAKKHGAKLELR